MLKVCLSGFQLMENSSLQNASKKCCFHTVPSSSQYINVGLITFLSGIIATSLFLYARSQADSSSKIVLVDACQSGEVVFALVGEIVFLNAVIPNAIELLE